MLSVACCDVAVSAPGETFHGMKKTQTKEDLQVDTGTALVSLFSWLSVSVAWREGERERERERKRGQQEIFMGAKCASLDRSSTWPDMGMHGSRASCHSHQLRDIIIRRSNTFVGIAAWRRGDWVKNGDDFRRADKTLWLARTLARTHDLRRRRAESGHRARPWEGKGREGTEDAGETMQPGLGWVVDRRI